MKVKQYLELKAEITMVTELIQELEAKIEIYSAIDEIRVKELSNTKQELEVFLLDLVDKQNEVWLNSIRNRSA